jgi:HAD superfamily hydrolase (TIGR01458 family)
MGALDGIDGILLDIDGTLLDGERAIPGTAEMIAGLRTRSVPFRLSTNTTRMPRSGVVAWLAAAGIEVAPREVFTPALLARMRILDSGRTRASLLVAPETRSDFYGIEQDDRDPDWVVVGDLGDGFTWEVLDRAFRRLIDGATLLALQKNRFWRVEGELRIDAGPFVAALEYAAGVEAELVGKPSSRFFSLVLGDLGLPPERVLVVGDDVTTDCAGGAAAGCRTALVRTGKFAAGGAVAPGGTRPDLVLDSAADLLGG